MSKAKVEELKVEAPGGRIFAKRWVPESDSNKSPVILLHDSLGCVDLWKDFPSSLAERLSRCVVAYDRLGFGKSDARDSLPSLRLIEEEAVKYFPAIKEQLSIQSYVLFGHSIGGAMVLNIASEDPDCRAAVTVSAQAFVEKRTIKGILEAKEMFEQPGQIERLKKWHGQKAAWVFEAWTSVWLSAEFKDWSLKQTIEHVFCPVLAIHGDSDEYGSSAFPEFIVENSGGQADKLIIENCGHIPHKERPEEVINATTEFLIDVS